MIPRFNVWLEIDGEVALSLWRIKLLAAIDEAGSISGGAAQMDVPYRIAWQKIHEMETRLEQQLVETQIGGRHGGGAQLTPIAHDYVTRFQQISQDVDTVLQRRFRDLFSPSASSHARTDQ